MAWLTPFVSLEILAPHEENHSYTPGIGGTVLGARYWRHGIYGFYCIRGNLVSKIKVSVKEKVDSQSTNILYFNTGMCVCVFL